MKAAVFLATLEHLHEMLQFIVEEAKQVGFDVPVLRKIEIAAEEAIVNVIQHSYQNQGGRIEISVRCDPKQEVEITISDEGGEFDPFACPAEYTPSGALEERKVGGLGLLFIQNFIDSAGYRRENGRNVLRLVKKYTETT